MSGDDYLEQSLGDFLDSLASTEPAPGGGAATAVAVGLAAGLVAMTAGFSESHVNGAAGMAARAQTLRARVGPLATQDAEAYQHVLAAYRLPRKPNPDRRNQTLTRALHSAAEVPSEIADTAAEIAELASFLAREGNPNLSGDAATAASLAAAAARSAAGLVRINVEAGALESTLTEQADRHARTAAEHEQQAAGYVPIPSRD